MQPPLSDTACAVAEIHVDWLQDLTISTLTIAVQSKSGRDRRCVFSHPQQKTCRVNNILIEDHTGGDGSSLLLSCRIHSGPEYKLPILLDEYQLPDVAELHRFQIDPGHLIVDASLAFTIQDMNWVETQQILPTLPTEPASSSSSSSSSSSRQLQFVPVDHLKTFKTSYTCDESLSCHYHNVVLEDLDSSERIALDHEQQVVWLYGERSDKPCANMPVTTTVHKRFVTSIGWRNGERPDIRMRGAENNPVAAANALQHTSSRCIKNPSILFTIPFHTYYYHAIAEGAVPLANAILRGYRGRRDVQLVNLQRWGGIKSLPPFLRDIFAALSDLPVLALEEVQLMAAQGHAYKSAALCFREMSTGFWPTLRTRTDFRSAMELLQQNILPSLNKQLYPKPPVPWQRGVSAIHTVVDGMLPVLVIVQRKRIDNINFNGQDSELKKATRVIRNVKALSHLGTDLGFSTKIVDFVGMNLREQVELMQEADVFAAVFGSAWANVVWMRREGTTAIMLLGWGFKDGCDFQMPSQTPVRLLSGMCESAKETGKEVEIEQASGKASEKTTKVQPDIRKRTGRARGTKFFYNDHCDAILHEFPALVDSTNSYIEIASKRSRQFAAPFLLDDWICHRDAERFETDYGARTNENVNRCMADHHATQNRAIANPKWAWENIGVNAAHLFFLNADLWVDTLAFERALVGALPRITRSPFLNVMKSTKTLCTCWATIQPDSDPLISTLARSALELLSVQKKTTAHVVGALIRFSVGSDGRGDDDMRLELQLECQHAGTKFFVAGVLTLTGNEQGIPFWSPVALGSSKDLMLWHDQRFGPAWNDSCIVLSGGVRVAAERAAAEGASSPAYQMFLRRLIVRLSSISSSPIHTGDHSEHDSQKEVVPWPVDRNYAVVGVAVNYGMDELRRFVGSLRATGYLGTIVLGVSSNLSQECLRYLKRHHVEIRFVVQPGKLTPKKQAEDGVHGGFYSVALPRWKMYQEWVEESMFSNGTRFFLTDTRDVYFQRNPFEDLQYETSYDLFMFEEWSNKTVGTCRHNSDWIRSCWGKSMLDIIAQHPIICSGTIIGSRQGITSLVDAFILEAARVKTLQHEVDGKAQHGRPCVNDQAYLNVLMRGLRSDSLATLKSSTKIFPQGDGPVNTIGWVAVSGSIVRDDDGFVLNNDGRRSAVVHQYDRDLTLQAWLDAKFVHVLDPTHEAPWTAGKMYSEELRTVKI